MTLYHEETLEGIEFIIPESSSDDESNGRKNILIPISRVSLHHKTYTHQGFSTILENSWSSPSKSNPPPSSSNLYSSLVFLEVDPVDGFQFKRSPFHPSKVPNLTSTSPTSSPSSTGKNSWPEFLSNPILPNEVVKITIAREFGSIPPHGPKQCYQKKPIRKRLTQCRLTITYNRDIPMTRRHFKSGNRKESSRPIAGRSQMSSKPKEDEIIIISSDEDRVVIKSSARTKKSSRVLGTDDIKIDFQELSSRKTTPVPSQPDQFVFQIDCHSSLLDDNADNAPHGPSNKKVVRFNLSPPQVKQEEGLDHQYSCGDADHLTPRESQTVQEFGSVKELLAHLHQFAPRNIKRLSHRPNPTTNIVVANPPTQSSHRTDSQIKTTDSLIENYPPPSLNKPADQPPDHSSPSIDQVAESFSPTSSPIGNYPLELQKKKAKHIPSSDEGTDGEESDKEDEGVDFANLLAVHHSTTPSWEDNQTSKDDHQTALPTNPSQGVSTTMGHTPSTPPVTNESIPLANNNNTSHNIDQSIFDNALIEEAARLDFFHDNSILSHLVRPDHFILDEPMMSTACDDPANEPTDLRIDPSTPATTSPVRRETTPLAEDERDKNAMDIPVVPGHSVDADRPAVPIIDQQPLSSGGRSEGAQATTDIPVCPINSVQAGRPASPAVHPDPTASGDGEARVDIAVLPMDSVEGERPSSLEGAPSEGSATSADENQASYSALDGLLEAIEVESDPEDETYQPQTHSESLDEDHSSPEHSSEESNGSQRSVNHALSYQSSLPPEGVGKCQGRTGPESYQDLLQRNLRLKGYVRYMEHQKESWKQIAKSKSMACRKLKSRLKRRDDRISELTQEYKHDFLDLKAELEHVKRTELAVYRRHLQLQLRQRAFDNQIIQKENEILQLIRLDLEQHNRELQNQISFLKAGTSLNP